MSVCMHIRSMHAHMYTRAQLRVYVCLYACVCMCTEAANPAGAVSHLLSKEWLAPVMAELTGVWLMH